MRSIWQIEKILRIFCILYLCLTSVACYGTTTITEQTHRRIHLPAVLTQMAPVIRFRPCRIISLSHPPQLLVEVVT